MKKIALENGISIVTFEPPSGFDPFIASPVELTKNGFPPIPQDPAQRERYQRMFNQLRHKLHYVPPTFRVNPDRVHGPRVRRPTDGTETSGNWSGGVVYAPAGQSFKWVEGDWVVPDVDAPLQNQWYYCASWIGIDGDGSADVCQAGVECEAYRSGTTITRHIYPWWEWYPGPEVQITNLAISPGDMIVMLICTAQGVGSTTATVYYTNRTTGASTSFSITAPGTTKLVGNSAEWIVEAPTVGGAQSQIADYGEVFFSVCTASLTNNTTVNGGTGNNINLTSGGNVVSSGTLINANIIQCQYAGTLPS